MPKKMSATAVRWKQHITRWRISNESQAHYCKTHKLNPKRFNAWIKSFEDDANNENNFAVLPKTNCAPARSDIEIAIGEKFVLRVNTNIHPHLLKEILHVMSTLC